MTKVHTKRRIYTCSACGRRLRVRDRVRWIYSKATGNRYCPPGHGCNK